MTVAERGSSSSTISPKYCPGPLIARMRLRAVLVRQVDLDPAREDQEKRIALVALADDDRLLGIAACDGALGELPQISFRNALEKGIFLRSTPISGANIHPLAPECNRRL